MHSLLSCRDVWVWRWLLQVAITLPGNTSAAAKELILGRITSILAAYRKYCATSSSSVSVQRSYL